MGYVRGPGACLNDGRAPGYLCRRPFSGAPNKQKESPRRRFLSAKKLVSYSGLCPTTRASGGKVRHGPPRGGRKLIRWALIEAAHTAVRKDPYFAAVFHRLAHKKCKQVAYVAVARKMAQIIWHLLSEKRMYEPRKKQSQVGSSRAMAAPQRARR